MSQTLLKTLLLMIAGVEKQGSEHGGYFSTEYDPSSEQINENSLTVDGKNAGAWVSLLDLIEMKSQKTTALLGVNTMLVDIVSRGGIYF